MSCLDGCQQLHGACGAARGAATSPVLAAQSACECLHPAVRLPLTASKLHRPTCAGVYAAARALLTVYGQLLDKGELDEDQFKLLASFDEFNSLVRLEERLAMEERYGRGDGMEKLTVR